MKAALRLFQSISVLLFYSSIILDLHSPESTRTINYQLLSFLMLAIPEEPPTFRSEIPGHPLDATHFMGKSYEIQLKP